MLCGERYAWECRRGAEELTIDVPGDLTLDRMALMVEAARDDFASPMSRTGRQATSAVRSAGRLLPDRDLEELGYMVCYPGRCSVPPTLMALSAHFEAIHESIQTIFVCFHPARSSLNPRISRGAAAGAQARDDRAASCPRSPCGTDRASAAPARPKTRTCPARPVDARSAP